MNFSSSLGTFSCEMLRSETLSGISLGRFIKLCGSTFSEPISAWFCVKNKFSGFHSICVRKEKRRRERERKNKISWKKQSYIYTYTTIAATMGKKSSWNCAEVACVGTREKRSRRHKKSEVSFTFHTLNREKHSKPTKRRHKFTTTGIAIFSLFFFSLPLWVTQVLGSETRNIKKKEEKKRKRKCVWCDFLLSFQELFLVYFYK